MQEFNINIDKENKSLEIRTGEALPIKEPLKVKLQGNIQTINEFLSKRNQLEKHGFQNCTSEKTVVLTNKEERWIKVITDPQQHYGAEITGKLDLSPELVSFGINSNSVINREKLVKLLRFSKRHFDSPEVHFNIFSAYAAFKANISSEIESKSDNRGNKSNQYSKEVNSNLPESFVLNIPIFKGFPKERFIVEICLEITDGGVHFWFESPELEELISLRIDEIFEQQTEVAIVNNILIVHQ